MFTRVTFEVGVEVLPNRVLNISSPHPHKLSGRREGLIVSALDPGASGPGSSPGLVCCGLGQDT